MIALAIATIVHAALLAAATVLLVLTVVLAVELLAASRAPSPGLWAGGAPSWAVVMPAHDEVGTIEPTLAKVLPELSASARLLVVADNCTDQTAAIARATGAEVVERREPDRRGKGYALAFAIESLRAAPPDVVIVLDADCIPEPGSLALLAAAAGRLGRPVQSRYELEPPAADAGPLARVGAFAWRIKNTLRPSGLLALDVPCLLMGTGMAFPWRTLAGARLASAHLVEDMVLGLELAAVGQGPRFLPEACVRSVLPPSLEGQRSQRTRWETGHLQVLRSWVPRLVGQSIARADWRLMLLTLHAAVPPLALLTLLLLLVTGSSALMAMAGGPTQALWTSLMAATIAAGVLVAYWQRVGRDLLAPRELALLPGYVLSKLLLHLRSATMRRVEWVRSKRD